MVVKGSRGNSLLILLREERGKGRCSHNCPIVIVLLLTRKLTLILRNIFYFKFFLSSTLLISTWCYRTIHYLSAIDIFND